MVPAQVSSGYDHFAETGYGSMTIAVVRCTMSRGNLFRGRIAIAVLASAAVLGAEVQHDVDRRASQLRLFEATRRFYGSVASPSVRDLVVEGDRACALTYRVAPPTGDEFESHVAELRRAEWLYRCAVDLLRYGALSKAVIR